MPSRFSTRLPAKNLAALRAAARIVLAVALGAGCGAREPCSDDDARADFVAPLVPVAELDCGLYSDGESALEDTVGTCSVDAIDESGPLVLTLRCNAPLMPALDLEIDLEPSGSIDLDIGDVVDVELRHCDYGVRLVDERGLVFAAAEHPDPMWTYVYAGAVGQLVDPLEVEIESRRCVGPESPRTYDDKLLIGDGDRSIVVQTGNSGVLEGSARWLVVAETLMNQDRRDDLTVGFIDFAVLRIR